MAAGGAHPAAAGCCCAVCLRRASSRVVGGAGLQGTGRVVALQAPLGVSKRSLIRSQVSTVESRSEDSGAFGKLCPRKGRGKREEDQEGFRNHVVGVNANALLQAMGVHLPAVQRIQRFEARIRIGLVGHALIDIDHRQRQQRLHVRQRPFAQPERQKVQRCDGAATKRTFPLTCPKFGA